MLVTAPMAFLSVVSGPSEDLHGHEVNHALETLAFASQRDLGEDGVTPQLGLNRIQASSEVAVGFVQLVDEDYPGNFGVCLLVVAVGLSPNGHRLSLHQVLSLTHYKRFFRIKDI